MQPPFGPFAWQHANHAQITKHCSCPQGLQKHRPSTSQAQAKPSLWSLLRYRHCSCWRRQLWSLHHGQLRCSSLLHSQPPSCSSLSFRRHQLNLSQIARLGSSICRSYSRSAPRLPFIFLILQAHHQLLSHRQLLSKRGSHASQPSMADLLLQQLDPALRLRQRLGRRRPSLSKMASNFPLIPTHHELHRSFMHTFPHNSRLGPSCEASVSWPLSHGH